MVLKECILGFNQCAFARISLIPRQMPYKLNEELSYYDELAFNYQHLV